MIYFHMHMAFVYNDCVAWSTQVSPELYGDNNTRLFSYWTVSLYH